MTTTISRSALSPVLSSLERGIWYEASRRRYRVRVYIGTKVAHQSYHRDVQEARDRLDDARTLLANRSLVPAPLNTAERQLAALFGDSHLIHGDSPLMSQLMTVDVFRTLYYTEASRPAKCTVWRWCRTGKLPSQRPGREYYIAKDDADAFTQQQRSLDA